MTGTPIAPDGGRIILECIAGKDEHRRIEVGGQLLRIGPAGLQPALVVEEPGPGQGYLTVRADAGILLIDAAGCSIPVYINNQEIGIASLRQQDVLRIGNSVWRARYDMQDITTRETGSTGAIGATDATGMIGATGSTGRIGATGTTAATGAAGTTATTAALGQRFSELIGLEELKDFRLSSIFSEVFKKHTEEQMEDQLITGTSRHTPALADLEVGWAKPWLFARLLAVSAILAFVLYSGFMMFANTNLVPGLIVVGSFAVPLSTLIFFLEMNVPRNVSIFKVTQLLFVGGVASIIVALVFFERLDFFSTYLGASAAGIIEESAKLLIVALMIGRATRYPWALNGLLFGAAIGTGFAAFESAGYAFNDLLSKGIDGCIASITLRGILAPFGHIVWTANAAAALWIVKGNRPFTWDMLKAPAFLRIFISVVILHMLWDAPFSLMRLPFILDLKYLILGILGWMICFRLVQAGLRQLNKARQEAASTGLIG